MDENKITAEELKQVIDANYESEVKTVWHGLQVEIKKCLSLQETVNFVEGVATLCFAENTNEYIPEVKDFAIRKMILEKYANFVLPDDSYEAFEFVYGSGVVQFVLEHVDRAHFDSMIEAIDAKVEYRAQSNVDNFTRQIEEIMIGFESLSKDIDKLSAGFDADTLMQLAGALADGAFDENKLASAVIAANNEKESGDNDA